MHFVTVFDTTVYTIDENKRRTPNMSQPPTFGIFDWAGNRLYDGKTWNNFNEAWDVIYADARKQLGDCSDKEFDDYVGEYFVEEL